MQFQSTAVVFTSELQNIDSDDFNIEISMQLSRHGSTDVVCDRTRAGFQPSALCGLSLGNFCHLGLSARYRIDHKQKPRSWVKLSIYFRWIIQLTV